LQAIPIGHRNRLVKIEQEILAIVGSQANTPAVAGLEIEGERPPGLLRRPVADASMNESAMHRISDQYMK